LEGPASGPVLHLGSVDIGARVVCAVRVDPSNSRPRPVVVRLACILYWTFANRHDHEIGVEENLTQWRRLETWKDVGSIHRNKIELSRDIVVKLDPKPPAASTTSSAPLLCNSHIVRLLDTLGEDLLTLDFSDKLNKAMDWHDALRFMTRPWVDIVAESKSHLGRRLFDSGLIQPLSPSVAVAGSCGRLERQAAEAGDAAQQIKLSFQQANGAFTGVTEWDKTVVNAAGFTQPLLEDVLGRVPVVGAGFLAVSFCLSGAKTLCDVVADRRYIAKVTREINFLAGHAVMEMMSAVKLSPDDGELSLRQLAPIMGNNEKASSTLDYYIVSNVAANAMRGTQLGPLLNELRSVGRELVSLKSYRNLQEIGARQETEMVATHED
jgi:hypothetical protein